LTERYRESPLPHGRLLSFERVYLYLRVQRKLRGGKVTSGGDGRDGDEVGR
jgi:hypothetical protein